MAETPAAPVSKNYKLSFKIKIRLSGLIYALGVGSLIIDRILKTAALAMDGSWGAQGWAEFTLFKNRGIAFSLPLPDVIFWPAALITLAVLLSFFVRQSRRRDPLLPPLLAVVIMGASSNLADRWLVGATIDYFLFFGRSAVNLADVMIVAGVAAILLTGQRQPTAGPPST
jgi:signal peptidase II